MKSIRIGSLWGVPVYVHWSTILFFLYIAVGQAYGELRLFLPQASIALRLILGVLSTMFLLASIFLHEVGHAGGARLVGMKGEQLVLNAFGAFFQPAEEFPSQGKLLLVVFLGPLVTLLLGFGFGIAAGAVPVYELKLVLQYASSINLLLFAVNCIPAMPLDGGWMIRAVVWQLLGSERKRDTLLVTGAVGALCSGALLLVGVFGTIGLSPRILLITGGAVLLLMNVDALLAAAFTKPERVKGKILMNNSSSTKKRYLLWLSLAIVVLILAGTVVASVILFGQYRLMNFVHIPGLYDAGAIRLTSAQVIGTDARNYPVLRLTWDSRPINTLEEEYQVFLWLGNDVTGYKVSDVKHDGAFYYAFGVTELMAYRPGTVFAQVRRSSDGYRSDKIEITLPELSTLSGLTPEDVGYASYPDPIHFSPNDTFVWAYLDANDEVPVTWTWEAEPLKIHEFWWFWYSGGNTTEFYGLTGIDQGKIVDQNRLHSLNLSYQDPKPKLAGSACFEVRLKVERILQLDWAAIVLQESEPGSVCIPPAEKLAP